MLLNEAQVLLRLEFEGPYRLHEIEGSDELALQPIDGPREDYWRCYSAETAPANWNLVIDDVVNPGPKPDVVDFTHEVIWAVETGSYICVPVVTPGRA